MIFAVVRRNYLYHTTVLDLVDALTGSGYIESLVILSENGLFKRKHSMTYDVMKHGKLDL